MQFKIAAGIVATVALLFAIFILWDYHLHRRQYLAELQDSAASLSKVISNGLIGVEMAGRHPELLQASIEQFGTDPSIAGIYLLDTHGTVRFSSKPALKGKNYAFTDSGCRDCHVDGSDRPTSSFVVMSGSQVLRNVVAVRNRPECHYCHSSATPLIGMLIVDLAAEGIKAKLEAVENEMLIKAGMTMVAILIALGLLMNRMVITRLKKLTASTNLLFEEREGPLPRTLEGPDEIGQLGTAFNHMVTSLEQYRSDVGAKEQLRGLLMEKIVRVQEAERKRISRELHDHVGQSLSALLLVLQNYDGSTEGLCERDEELNGRIRSLIDEVHQLAWEMRPSILDDYGLDSALQTYVQDTAKLSGLPIDYQFSSRPGMDRLPPWIEVILYRVAQEALTNVVRHSQASRVSVVLLRQVDEVTLLIEDDGCGFEPPHPPSSHKGLGLIGMRERVNLCGGSCMIESALKCGTTVRVKVPLAETIQ